MDWIECKPTNLLVSNGLKSPSKLPWLSEKFLFPVPIAANPLTELTELKEPYTSGGYFLSQNEIKKSHLSDFWVYLPPLACVAVL